MYFYFVEIIKNLIKKTLCPLKNLLMEVKMDSFHNLYLMEYVQKLNSLWNMLSVSKNYLKEEVFTGTFVRGQHLNKYLSRLYRSSP